LAGPWTLGRWWVDRKIIEEIAKAVGVAGLARFGMRCGQCRWRIRTGRTTAEKLGLQMSWPSAYVLRGKAPKPAAALATAPQPVAA
jgi:hypothetical protein